ncbi:RNA-directed DNA polymerase [Pseudanabaena sp. BC1403]|uniref:RNA-directed DNA polymerase n=1 Tax=Pseudanabaena sp. BC1403 TaxID=2043171 RepID=UPI0015E197F7|nr:RNA-directed DNA polymerase [Pseudanabaena sp. BC1403]
MKNVLELNHTEAKTYFIKAESYFTFDLPRYYIFDKLIHTLSEKIEGKLLSDFYGSYHDMEKGKPKATFPSDYENVNYRFLNNKDGRYSWRPLQLMHPAIYVSLVHKITEENNWNLIVQRFSEFRANKNINCYSIPLKSESESSDKAETVTNWWEAIEQRSIELALKFDYILHTDISDCYGSIYTHSVPWALHTKELAKAEKHNKHLIGNIIDTHLQNMSFGQTNGIPQGSVLMDFIAEMVLGFVDLELSKRVINKDLKDFEVIRYRDDYRVFTNSPQDAEFIVKHITEILMDLGMCLNPHKTRASSNVIEESIKPDKLFWILNKRGNKNIQEHLFLIHSLAKKYPNSGSLVKAMNKFLMRIKSMNKTSQNINVLISIVVDIAYRNPRIYPMSTAILSELFLFLEESEKEETINLIINKFDKIPNTGHLQVWLQRAILKHQRERYFEEKLCQKLNEPNTLIWNSEWLSEEMKNLINYYPLIDEEILNNMDETLSLDEVQLFGSKSNYIN